MGADVTVPINVRVVFDGKEVGALSWAPDVKAPPAAGAATLLDVVTLKNFAATMNRHVATQLGYEPQTHVLVLGFTKQVLGRGFIKRLWWLWRLKLSAGATAVVREPTDRSKDETWYAVLDMDNLELRRLVSKVTYLSTIKSPWRELLAASAAAALGLTLLLVGFLVTSTSHKAQLEACVYFGMAMLGTAALLLAAVLLFNNIGLKASYGGASLQLDLEESTKDVGVALDISKGISDSVATLTLNYNRLRQDVEAFKAEAGVVNSFMADDPAVAAAAAARKPQEVPLAQLDDLKQRLDAAAYSVNIRAQALRRRRQETV